VSAPVTGEGWTPVASGATTFAHRGPDGSVWVSDGSAVVRVPRDLLVPLAKALIAERVSVARKGA
jgi:streptogramin lyase